MSDTAGKRIAKNTGLMFIGKGGGAIFNVLVLWAVTNAVDTVTVGLVFLIHSTMLLIGELGAFKSWQALIKYGVPHIKRDNINGLHRLIRFSIGVDLVTAFMAFVIAEVFLWIGAELIGLSPDVRYLAMAYCVSILMRQRSASIGVLRLVDRFDLLAMHSVVLPFTRFVGAVIVWRSGGGITEFVIVWFIAGIFEHFVLWALALGVLRKRGLLKGLFSKRPSLREPEAGLWRFSLTAHIDASMVVAKQELPLLLAGGVLGPAFAAVFKVAVQIASVLTRGTQQLDEVIYPELAKLVEAGETWRIWPLILRTGAILVAIALFTGGLVAAFGPQVLSRLLGQDFGPSAGIALLLLLAGAISAAYSPLLPTLYAAGRPGQAAIARAAGVVVLLVLFVVFTASIGPLGSGWAFIIGDTVALILAGVLTQRALARQMREDDKPPSPDRTP